MTVRDVMLKELAQGLRPMSQGIEWFDALSGVLIGKAGVRGRPGGKPTWGPPAHAALRRLVATARH